jgi:hypothetical protein
VAQSLEQTKAGLRFKTPKTKRRRRTVALSPSLVEQRHRAKQAADRGALAIPGLQEDAAQRIDAGLWNAMLGSQGGNIGCKSRFSVLPGSAKPLKVHVFAGLAQR